MDPTSPATVTEDLLAGVAATGLPGSILERPRRPLPDEQVEQLVTAATGSGVGRGLVGLLREAVVSGALPATDAQQARVLHCHDEVMTRAAGVVDELGEIVDTAHDRGVAVRVLGDLVRAHVDYDRPELRPWGDIHLLVKSAHNAEVGALLAARGFLRSGRHLRADFASRYSDGVRYRRPGGPEVFVHRTLAGGPYGIRIDEQSLWREAVPVLIGQRLLHTVGGELRLLHLAFDVTLGGDRSLVAMRDIAELVLAGRCDADTVRDLAQAWNCCGVLALAVDAAWEALAIADVVALSRWAARYHPTPDETRLLRLYRPPRRGYARRGVATLQELPGVRPKLRFAWSLGVPERDFLVARQVSRSGWILHGVGQLLFGEDPQVNGVGDQHAGAAREPEQEGGPSR